MSNKTAYIGLIAILVFASLLRFYHLGNFGIFGDEKQGIMVAVGNVNIGGKKALMAPDKTFTPKDFWQPKTIAELLDANARGDTSGNATVHLISMNIFGKLFGHSDFALRSVSVLFNLLTILFIFLIGKNILKSNYIALLAAFLASFEPFYIVYSQQARFYTTCICFSTIASYYFLQIMLYAKVGKRTYIAYILAILLSIFSNYLTCTVLFAHGLFWLFTDRTWDKLKNLSICYAIMFVPFGLWMTIGPGQYALLYIKDATNLYKNILNNPALAASYAGFIDLASWSNLLKRGVSIVDDYFIFTNGLYEKVGTKLGLVALVLLLITMTLTLLYKATKGEIKLFIFSGLVIFIPFIFSLLSAYNAGVMTGFYFRYTSFGLPFVAILVAWFVTKAYERNKVFSAVLVFIMLGQSYNFARILVHFYRDAPQKYSASHDRIANPYYTIAQTIVKTYADGDTILYPSMYENSFTKAIKRASNEFDNNDAQLVNLYLPKDATYIQKIAMGEANRVILKKKNKQTIILFDFEGNKYRY